MKQEFKVTVRVKTDVEVDGKKYLTEKRVGDQLRRFLHNRSIAEGLPCHGTSEFLVTDVLEVTGKGW